VFAVLEAGQVVGGLVDDHLEAFDQDVVEPAGVGFAGVAEGDAGVDVAVLQGGGDQPAPAAHHEVGQA